MPKTLKIKKRRTRRGGHTTSMLAQLFNGTRNRASAFEKTIRNAPATIAETAKTVGNKISSLYELSKNAFVEKFANQFKGFPTKIITLLSDFDTYPVRTQGLIRVVASLMQPYAHNNVELKTVIENIIKTAVPPPKSTLNEVVRMISIIALLWPTPGAAKDLVQKLQQNTDPSPGGPVPHSGGGTMTDLGTSIAIGFLYLLLCTIVSAVAIGVFIVDDDGNFYNLALRCISKAFDNDDFYDKNEFIPLSERPKFI